MNFRIGCFPIICSIIGGSILGLGPIGAILGFIFGLFFNVGQNNVSGKISDQVLYHISALFAAVMKADNAIMQSELYSFRDFFLQRFGSEAAGKAIDYLKELKDKNIKLQEHTGKLNLKLNYTERLEIIRYLFQISYVDGDISQAELNVIRQIAQYFQIRQQDFIYVYNSYTYTYQQRNYYQQYGYRSDNSQYQSPGRRSSNLDADYALLGVKRSDTDETIKKAYRRLAIDNHPDKVAHLGEAARKEAEKRFAEINEAYQRIKNARNMV